MTVFITHCWKSVGLDVRGLVRGFLVCCCVLASTAWGQNAIVELTELRAERQESALLLHAQLKLELGPAVEDALVKGLAVHFVAETEVMRDRWYWYDRKLGVTARYYRLAYQPLTRRWRLNVSHEPISSGGQGGISQAFDTLAEALGVVRRQSAWKVANVGDFDADARQYLVYRFKLDVSQLPRPFQIAAGNQSDWSLEISRQLRLSAEMVR